MMGSTRSILKRLGLFQEKTQSPATATFHQRPQLIGLDQAWVDGTATIEPPCHLFQGFGVRPSMRLGAFSYSFSFIPPIVQSIGRYCSIAENVKFGNVEHETQWLTTSSFAVESDFMSEKPGASIENSRFVPSSRRYDANLRAITIGNDVWIGSNSYIRHGVTLGDGCVVGAFAVITKDVPPYAIMVGNPARIAKYRFTREIIERLLASAWWQFSFTDFEGVDVTRPEQAIVRIGELVKSGMQVFAPTTVIVVGDGHKKQVLHAGEVDTRPKT